MSVRSWSLVRGSLPRLRKSRIDTVLGLACTGHGASIAVMTADGSVRCSVLDRWAGVKHVILLSRDEDRDIRNPKNKIDDFIHFCFRHGFGRLPETRIFEDVIVDWLNWLLRGLNLKAPDIDLVVTSESHFATCQGRLGPHLHRWFPRARFLSSIEHHQVHQRQAFWQSGFEEAAVLTLDSSGEVLERTGGKAVAGMISHMNVSGVCRTLSEFYFPESSPGLLYDAVSKQVGFPLGEEGKTMGLAPYGSDELLRRLQPHLTLLENGGFSFLPMREFHALLNDYVPTRQRDEEITERHRNVAYAGQALLEQIVQNAFQVALRLTGQRKLAYCGGVALNCVANDIAFRAIRPEALYVAPNPGDTGHALGCALYGAFEVAKWKPRLQEIPEYTAPTYKEEEMVEAARASGYQVHRPDSVARKMARCIANGYITARFDGGAEFGPRALGNRSILCDPRRPDMKDYLNDRVKHRESFRPFAPSVLEECASDWFVLDQRSAFMLRAVAVREAVRNRIPAVVHVDGTCRVQTVSLADNAGFYEVIREFRALTSVPLVLNTSFNVAGKPIVETPKDAVDCFVGTEIDVLALGPLLLAKKDLSCYETPRT
jgi:carbamoyltransferase